MTKKSVKCYYEETTGHIQNERASLKQVARLAAPTHTLQMAMLSLMISGLNLTMVIPVMLGTTGLQAAVLRQATMGCWRSKSVPSHAKDVFKPFELSPSAKG